MSGIRWAKFAVLSKVWILYCGDDFKEAILKEVLRQPGVSLVLHPRKDLRRDFFGPDMTKGL